MKKILFIAILTLTSCGNKEASETKEPASESTTSVRLTQTQLKNANIQTGYVRLQDVKSVIRATGKIDVPPQNMVSVSFPLGGYLKSTKLLPGMHIRKGEVIAVMEDQQYIQLQQDYLTAKAKQNYLEQEYLRQKELNRTKASSDKVFQQAEAEYNSNKVLISSLGEKLQLIGMTPGKLNDNNISGSVNIYAPIDGYVSAVKVNTGKYVTPSDVLFELVNPEDIHLVITIFEKDINSLQIGQKVMAYTNSNPDTKYPCKIILIGKDVSAERSVLVHCHFDEYDHTLVPGMYMNAAIEVNSDSAYVVPENAVVRFENKDYVFADMGNSLFEMKEVTAGNRQDGNVAIYSAGVNLSNQAIVVQNAYVLLMAIKNKGE